MAKNRSVVEPEVPTIATGAQAPASLSRPQGEGRRRVIIEGISPEVDGGRFAAKRTLGDLVRVEADVFTDGHDSVAAVVLFRHEDTATWTETPMRAIVNDRWFAEFPVTELGRYRYTVHAWVDHWETWRRDLLKRIAADSDTPLDYLIGAELIRAAAERAGHQSRTDDSRWLREQADLLSKNGGEGKDENRSISVSPALHDAMLRNPDRQFATELGRELILVVDPVRARFSSWYEFFPRSASSEPGKHGTFADCEARLPYVAELGFDVLYFPPIHPIGTKFRKGKNNSVNAAEGDVGSPWAIGSAEGGHKSIHRQLGTLEDFRRLVKKASEHGIQIALDIAFQAAPDHPYVQEHEAWFKKRPDGTIQYAENPPKKYQDIYPFDFESSDWFGMWEELKSVFTYWAEQGVRIFRVDNPHTKAFPFWEWAITEIKREYPDALFLSEAFTRPKVMYRLAKVGFSQSYTYFPWRNGKREIAEYLTELNKPPVVDFFRANQWPNTPDILTEFLQLGTRAAFMIRFLLAATLGANYGIYGPAFELLESRPLRAGSEEYLDSEKYQIREWNLNRPDSLREMISLVNRIRKENEALQYDRYIQFHPVDNDMLLCFSKRSPDENNLIVVVINLDPHHKRSGFIDLPLDQMKIEANKPYQAHDLLTGARYLWTGPRNYVDLDPASVPAHILRIKHRSRVESDFEYFL
jgi:starch synthase (maltosyl-transferring)